eukprot:m.65833 g.65833  ORF g.65833 m.65833 type:complete len:360 (+) comp14009_c0_seq1:293-1372(+)
MHRPAQLAQTFLRCLFFPSSLRVQADEDGLVRLQALCEGSVALAEALLLQNVVHGGPRARLHAQPLKRHGNVVRLAVVQVQQHGRVGSVGELPAVDGAGEWDRAVAVPEPNEFARRRLVVLVDANRLCVQQTLLHHRRHVADVRRYNQRRAADGPDTEFRAVLRVSAHWAVVRVVGVAAGAARHEKVAVVPSIGHARVCRLHERGQNALGVVPVILMVAGNSPRLRNLRNIRRNQRMVIASAELKPHRPPCGVQPVGKVAVQSDRVVAKFVAAPVDFDIAHPPGRKRGRILLVVAKRARDARRPPARVASRVTHARVETELEASRMQPVRHGLHAAREAVWIRLNVAVGIPCRRGPAVI